MRDGPIDLRIEDIYTIDLEHFALQRDITDNSYQLLLIRNNQTHISEGRLYSAAKKQGHICIPWGSLGVFQFEEVITSIIRRKHRYSSHCMHSEFNILVLIFPEQTFHMKHTGMKWGAIN